MWGKKRNLPPIFVGNEKEKEALEKSVKEGALQKDFEKLLADIAAPLPKLNEKTHLREKLFEKWKKEGPEEEAAKSLLDLYEIHMETAFIFLSVSNLEMNLKRNEDKITKLKELLEGNLHKQNSTLQGAFEVLEKIYGEFNEELFEQYFKGKK